MQKYIPVLTLFILVMLSANGMSLEQCVGDPEKEFKQNLKEGNVVLYSVGSMMYGYRFPGIGKCQLREIFPNWRKNWVNRFQDDPAPVFVEAEFTMEAYWEAVEEFLVKYNSLVIEYELSKAQPVAGGDATR